MRYTDKDKKEVETIVPILNQLVVLDVGYVVINIPDRFFILYHGVWVMSPSPGCIHDATSSPGALGLFTALASN
jgi:hypothetical protein